LANLVRRDGDWQVDELSMTTEHAPFRHRKSVITTEVGTQIKRQKVGTEIKADDTINPPANIETAVRERELD
jgi:hypothetical protein